MKLFKSRLQSSLTQSIVKQYGRLIASSPLNFNTLNGRRGFTLLKQMLKFG
jgi:hypothetical protein